MRFPIIRTPTHKGKTLDLNIEAETLTVIGKAGETLGTVAWESLVEFVQAGKAPHKSPDTRKEQRASLLVKVRYTTPDGQRIESRASGIGGGGLFIESTSPLRVGTNLAVEFALPDQPAEWLETRCIVSWVCPKPDQYTFFPGMGVRFTDISPEVRARVLELVGAINRTGSPQA